MKCRPSMIAPAGLKELRILIALYTRFQGIAPWKWSDQTVGNKRGRQGIRFGMKKSREKRRKNSYHKGPLAPVNPGLDVYHPEMCCCAGKKRFFFFSEGFGPIDFTVFAQDELKNTTLGRGKVKKKRIFFPLFHRFTPACRNRAVFQSLLLEGKKVNTFFFTRERGRTRDKLSCPMEFLVLFIFQVFTMANL